MTNFKGITVAYRKTEEYLSWHRDIKKDYPTLPDYLIEMAISHHQMNPQAYKQAYKDSKLKPVTKESQEKKDTIILGAGIGGSSGAHGFATGQYQTAYINEIRREIKKLAQDVAIATGSKSLAKYVEPGRNKPQYKRSLKRWKGN